MVTRAAAQRPPAPAGPPSALAERPDALEGSAAIRRPGHETVAHLSDLPVGR